MHHSSAEQLVSKNRGTMDRLDDYTHMIRENGMIKQEQLIDLRPYREDDSLTQEMMIDILIQKRATPQTHKKITFNERKLNKYFPAYYSQTQIEKILIDFCEEWKRTHESEE